MSNQALNFARSLNTFGARGYDYVVAASPDGKQRVAKRSNLILNNSLSPNSKRIIVSEKDCEGAVGGEIVLNNAAPTGYTQNITNLTYIKQQTVESKYYQIPFADYVPVSVGEGAFMDNMLTYRTYNLSGDFFSNVVKQASSSKINTVDVGIDAISYPTFYWIQELQYSLLEVEQAARMRNWSLIEAKEESAKKSWDLGLQKLAFLGNPNDVTNCAGLLTLPNVTINSSLITKPISTMSDSEFQTFMLGLPAAYLANSYGTARPDTFTMPLLDFSACANIPAFITGYSTNNISRLEFIKQGLQTLNYGQPVTVEGVFYNDQNYNGLGFNRYMLYRYKSDALKLDIPVNYTTTLAGTYNNFQWQSVSYGQFTGVQLYRPAEVLYFDYSN